MSMPYFPPQGGGLERYAYEIGTQLVKEGYRVVVVTSGERFGQDSKEEKDGMVVYRLAYRTKCSNTPFSFSWFAKIRRIIK